MKFTWGVLIENKIFCISNGISEHHMEFLIFKLVFSEILLKVVLSEFQLEFSEL